MKIQMFCDGACRGNPGPGAWAVILRYNDIEKELCGLVSSTTTNNKMELQAVIEGFKALKKTGLDITVTTDSQYVVKGMSEWIHNWKKKNWNGVANIELWQQLDQLSSEHNVNWCWVKGHNKHKENERCDQLCNIELDKLKSN